MKSDDLQDWQGRKFRI